jgi:4-diphosphocytidyl-2-C-methyl-D-erythritol kinase
VALELVAPAKLNLTLEILGQREDGYHEIASVMQTIDLVDRVRLEVAEAIELVVGGEQVLGVPLEGPRNLAYRAALALAEEARDPDLGVRIELEKNIPAGMGFGGGSSDAAAVLRGLNQLWNLNLDGHSLLKVANRVGSDVGFFLLGGTALVTGRGDEVEALPDLMVSEVTLFTSRLELEDKTRRMYATIVPADYSDGKQTRVAAEAIRRGLPLGEVDLVNAFDRHIGQVAAPMAGAMVRCRMLAGLGVSAAGSGPGFYAYQPLATIPSRLIREMEEWDVQVIGCRTWGREDSLRVREV